MAEPLLWNLNVAAQQLGDVSTRTVRRMIERGDLPVVRIGRSVRIPSAAVRKWVDKHMTPAHNVTRAEPGVRNKEVIACRTVAKTVRSGGCPSQIRVAKELGKLLGQQIEKKRRP